MKRVFGLVTILLFIAGSFLTGCQRYALAQGDPEPAPQFELPHLKPKVALVLGGGGAKGLAHVGVLLELGEAGIYPDLIVGCSSGALIGALYADQPDVKRLEKLLIDLKRTDLLDFSFFSRFGVVKGQSLRNFLKEHLAAEEFSALRIPLIVVATDLHTGELIEFGGGPLIPALCASAAVPGVFRPVPYLGRHLIDGGAVDPVPVRIAKKYGAQVIIAVDVGETLSKENLFHLFDIAKRGLAISYRQLALQSSSGADILIQMNFQDVGMFSDSYNHEIYIHGRQTAKAMLPQIEAVIMEKLTSFPSEEAPRWLLLSEP